MLDIRNQTVRLKEDIPLVCDRKWTTEALINLLKNASECSQENSEILVDSGENPIYRWISVTDQGKGLKKDQLAGLFRRFEALIKKTDMESGCLWLFPLCGLKMGKSKCSPVWKKKVPHCDEIL